jgi:hypothetical protein
MCRTAMVLLVLCFALITVPFSALAGPPFKTDDPEPVEFKNWEIYLASQYSNDRSGVSATAPHVEINYGIMPNAQLHIIAPMEYVKPAGSPSHYGYGDTELGIKYRFFENEEAKFMIGTFPLVEIPTGDQSRGLGNGDAQLFLPIWLQKGWGPWQSYGGGGYWINPGDGHQDFWFLGWQIQREINKNLTLGGEIFHQSPSEIGGESHTGFNIGAIINITDNHHILMSAGRDIDGPNLFSSYIAYQLTFGPEKEKGPAETETRLRSR